MGGRSRKSGNTVQKQSAEQMRANEKHKVSNSTMLDILEQLQGGQLGGILPIFGSMVEGGLDLFNQNPMMPGEMQAPEFNFAPPMLPPQQQQVPPQQVPPQQGMYNYGVSNSMGIPVPRGRHTFGGIKS